MDERYKVKKAKHVKIITLVLGLIFLVAELILIHEFLYWDVTLWLTVLIACLLPALVICFFVQMPRYILLSDTSLILRKVAGRVEIKYDDIDQVEPFVPDKVEIRLFGSGGFFGYIGKFSNKRIGVYNSYVGDYDQSFLIVTKSGKKYVFSAENRDELVGKIKLKTNRG